MSLYPRLYNTALRLLQNYGVEYTFTHITPGAYDPATDTDAPGTSTDYTAYCVRDQYSVLEKADSSVEVGDISMIATVANFDVDDLVEIDSEDYRIVNVEPIKPGPTTLAYILQLRR